jgi:hypothetical protein
MIYCSGRNKAINYGLIDRVSGKGMWESNPWVWVYEFELTDNPNKS